MKKFLVVIAFAVFSFTVAKASSETTVEISIAGDTYYATDNEKGVGFHGESHSERKLSSSNIFKDRFGTNNVLLHAKAESHNWRTNVAIATFGEGIEFEEANVGLRLYEGLWVTGGMYALWDVAYTYDRWFTGSSLTDLRGMANYAAWGLEYGFTECITLGVGVMNSAFQGVNEDHNLSKAIYAKLDFDNLYKFWGLTVSYVGGNEAHWGHKHENQSLIYLYAHGPIIYRRIADGSFVPRLEAQLAGKFFMNSFDDDAKDNISSVAMQALVRYHFNEKFSAGARFSFAGDADGIIMDVGNTGIDFGIVCEYKPVPFAYFRLEGGMLSLSNSDNENLAKRFWNGDEFTSSRLGLALSMGFKLGLFEREIR